MGYKECAKPQEVKKKKRSPKAPKIPKWSTWKINPQTPLFYSERRATPIITMHIPSFWSKCIVTTTVIEHSTRQLILKLMSSSIRIEFRLGIKPIFPTFLCWKWGRQWRMTATIVRKIHVCLPYHSFSYVGKRTRMIFKNSCVFFSFFLYFFFIFFIFVFSLFPPLFLYTSM